MGVLSLKKWRKTVARFLLVFASSSILICLALRWLPPPTSTFMLYCHVQDLIEGKGFKPIRYQWVAKEHISQNARTAVIAAEDQRFFLHAGFDLTEIQSSIDNYREGRKLRGASTISQQVAKNLFLTPSKNFIRKLIEAWFTFLIELLWDKQRILEVYLNIAEFGDHLYGIEAASQHYFGASANKISRSQAALLAATLPNPLIFQAANPSNELLKKQQWVLKQMANQ